MQLRSAILSKRSAVCVGLDPRWSSLPSNIRGEIEHQNRRAVAQATAKFCCEVVDAVEAFTPIIKPQAAFFEQLGPEGMQALASVIQHCRKRSVLVLLDGKRGDIGSTAEAYADAYLGVESAWGCDALTINPFLGEDTLEPFLRVANDRSAGLFVLVKTSNPGSGFLQDKQIDGEFIYESLADLVQSFAKPTIKQGYGSVGAVVGATYPEQLSSLRKRMPNAWILIPGYGAQGGTAADVAYGFDEEGLGAIVNSSRGIIFAYQSSEYAGRDWQHAVAEAARDTARQIWEATGP